MPINVRKKRKRIVIVGAGMSGITAGAYITREGHELLIFEKSSQAGGLVGSFSKDGFLFDTGPRAIGNAGILVPMVEELDIDLPLVKGNVSTGIRNHIVHYDSDANIDDFVGSLRTLFPESLDHIKRIDRQIRKNTRMAEVLNKVANPFFKNIVKDRSYLFKDLLPWLPSFLSVLVRTSLSNRSVEAVLDSISSNGSLNDMVSQHFFKGTPAHFAFGYFANYQDYKYPLGGTAQLPKSLVRKITDNGGTIRYETEIVKVNSAEKMVIDQNGEEYSYDLLLWAADLQSLYRLHCCEGCSSKVKNAIAKEERRYLSVSPGESVFSIFLAVDLPPEVFRKISRGHFIYTPRQRGLGELHRSRLDRLKKDFSTITKQELFDWLKDFCVYNSYEISIPVLKDDSLAPSDKTGLIISLLFDGELCSFIDRSGWYDEFKEKMTASILDALETTVYPGLKDKILFKKTATPKNLMDMFGTANGAITGWSLEEKPPVPNSLAGILGTVKTAIPDVYKAGQWSYSPAGVPIAILTGRIAAGEILKRTSNL